VWTLSGFINYLCNIQILIFMKITLYTQSKKDYAPINIRLRDGRKVDAKALTPFFVNPDRFKDGILKQHRTPARADAKIKRQIKEKNDTVIKLQNDIDNLINEVKKQFNNRNDYETINSRWLKNIVNIKKERTPTKLVKYFDVYFKDKKTSLRKSTIKKLKTFQSRLKKYEAKEGIIYIAEIDKGFKNNLIKWLDEEGYAHNTKVQTFKVIVTICNHAKEKNKPTHSDLSSLISGLKYQSTIHIYLNLSEIEKIKDVKLDDLRLDYARDWLLISCNTAQRMSDFLKFTKKNIIEIDDDSFLDIKQEKTDTPVYVYLNDNVKEILEKYDGDFPPIFANNVGSNETIYNRLIKRVCENAKINEIVKANLRQTKNNRYSVVEVPKYKAVSSHIGRRSYATNYYGKMSTELLMSATGHKSERQFLAYVKLAQIDRAKALAKAYKQLSMNKDVKLSIVKESSNS